MSILIYIPLCVLPGIAICRFVQGRRSSLSLPEMATWSVLSHAIVALLAFYACYAGLGVGAFRIVGAATLIFSITYLIWDVSAFGKHIASKDFLLTAGLACLLFLPMLSVRNWFAFHGFWHVSIVNSVTAGHFPPGNPGLVDTPISYVWIYHLWIAFVTYWTGLPPALVNVVSHVQLLIGLAGATWLIADHFGIRPDRRRTAFWIWVGTINIGAIVTIAPYLVYWAVTPPGLAEAVTGHISGNINPFMGLTGHFLGLPLFYKSWALLYKFYNFTSMAHGLVYLYLALIALHAAMEAPTRKAWVFHGLSTLALCLLYPVYLPFLVLFSGAYCAITLWNDRETLPGCLRALSIGMGACVLSLPYYLLTGSHTGNTDTAVFSWGFNPSHAWFHGLGSFWPLIPIVLYGVRHSLGRAVDRRFLYTGAVLSLLFPVFVSISGGPANYKMTFVSAYFFAWIAILVLADARVASTRIGRSVHGVYTGLAITTAVFCVMAWTLSPWFSDDRFTYTDSRQVAPSDPQTNDVVAWLRDEAEPSGGLLVPMPVGDGKANTAYTLSGLTGKPFYVLKDRAWVLGISDAAARLDVAEYIWNGRDEMPDHRPLPATLYAIVSDSPEGTRAFYERWMDRDVALAGITLSGLARRIESVGWTARVVHRIGDLNILRITEEDDLAAR